MDATHVSELLFGRACRLGVAAWVLNNPKARLSSPSQAESRASSTNLRDELARLVELGMLEVERPEDSRRIYYVRTNSPLWDFISAALNAIEAETQSPW